MRCRLCLAVQPRSLTARTLGPTSCSTKRQPQWRSSSMAGIIPIHSHYHTRDAPLSPPPRQSQTEPVTAPGSKPHTRQQSHERPGTQARSTTMSGTPNQGPGLRYPANKKSIYDRNLNRSKNAELSRAAFAYLFIEMIAYAQRGVSNVGDLEQKYIQRRNHTKTHADVRTDSIHKDTQSACGCSTCFSRDPRILSPVYDRLASYPSSSSSRKRYIDTSLGGLLMRWKSQAQNLGNTCSSITSLWSISTYRYQGS